jgi:pyruvate dehydrogenase E2 component (dihydrolipoamide acetyltransferase)
MMATNVLLPALGFDMTSGAVARWLKNEGDAVREGEAIAEVDTEKATVEIQAFATGVLQKILVAPGQNVPVGTAIAIIGVAGETVNVPATQPVAATPITNQSAEIKSPEAKNDAWIKASPVARKIAEVEKINLAEIVGTGPGGRIVEKDVKQFLARRATMPAHPSTPLRSAQDASRSVQDTNPVALTRIRQAIARRMTESKTTVPHFYVTFEINLTEAMRMREQLNALGKDDEKISVNDLVIAAVARTLTKWRMFNASFRGDKLELHTAINIGIAVARDDGLITPVLHDADKKSLKELARASRALAERTRANKMRPDDLTGGTFTISNLGMFGVEEFSAIINPPEAAILAVSAVIKKPIVVGEQVQIAQMLKATLSVDHRVADGAQAAQMMRDLKTLLENPINLLIG